jgi:hypothetical protein
MQSAGIPEVVEARIVITRGKHVMEESVPVVDNSFSATLQVPIGEWEVTVLLVDSQGMVLFQSKTEKTQISLAQSKVLDLVLQPAGSKVHVSIDLEDYVFKHTAMRARIYFNDEFYEVTREDYLTPLQHTLELIPGSYEFKIELYTESFRIGDRIGMGVWDLLHIAEKEEFFLTWSPVTEVFQVSGRVETLIPCPENVRLTPAPEGVLVTWDPVNHQNVVGYFVLAQTSPIQRFQLLNSIPLEETSFLHVTDEDHPSEVHYVVTAVSASGLAGYYSDPQIWHP